MAAAVAPTDAQHIDPAVVRKAARRAEFMRWLHMMAFMGAQYRAYRAIRLALSQEPMSKSQFIAKHHDDLERQWFEALAREQLKP